MVFSSAIFLFAFMPLFFGIYYLTPVFAKNFFIFAASTLFYAMAGGYLTLILLASIAVNYTIAHVIAAGRINPQDRFSLEQSGGVRGRAYAG